MEIQSKVQERRYKMVFVNPQILLGFMQNILEKEFDTYLPDLSCLPKDSQVLEIYYDYTRHCFGFLIYSREFDIIPGKCEIPAIERFDCEYKIIHFLRKKIQNGKDNQSAEDLSRATSRDSKISR